FLVTSQELPCIRNAQRYIAYLMRMGFTQDQIKVVVNRYQKKVGPNHASLEQVQQTLNQPVFYGIPHSPVMLASINKARPMVADQGIPMTLAERERVIEEILDEVFGLGPLEPLLKDPTISDIMVNGFDNVYIERGGRMVETNIRFKDQNHVRLIIERIVSAVGRRIDDSSPIVDARLADGSRVCAVIPPLSLIGPVISIRRYGKKVLSTEDLLKNETLTTGMLDFLSGCVEARLNIVISGGSGSGKTTML